MSGSEDRLTKLLTFPFGSYLMVRLEYVLLTEGEELEAKILRLVEKHMEEKRRQLLREWLNTASPQSLERSQVVAIPKAVWVPISHHLFLYELYGVVKSENTLKRAIKALEHKRLLLLRPNRQPDRHAPMEYQLNLALIEAEFVKMAEQGKAGYQWLRGSMFDTLENRPGYQTLTPSESQELIPSGGQFLIPSPRSPRSARVSNIDPHNRKNYSRRIFREEALERGMQYSSEVIPATAAESSLGELSQEEIALILSYRQRATRENGAATGENVSETVEATSNEELTEEGIVQLFEQMRGEPYEQRERELAAAKAVLRLKLPVVLSASWLERVYSTFNDAKFRGWYGSMEVHHLPEQERSGRVRLVRWLNRLVALDNLEAERTGQRTQSVSWQQKLQTEEEAHNWGYQGGFERFRKGDDPADDLEVAAAKLRALGKLATGGSDNG